MDLNEINVFLKVVQLGSFTRAAKALDMPNSTVSAKVSSLEARLGVALIRRTTRKLFVTDAGQVFFDRCSKGLTEIRSAEEDVTLVQSEPQGVLRITAPVELGAVLLPPVIAAFSKKHPKVSLDFLLSDRKVDLVADGVDLAIRAGELQNSSLIAKKLGSAYFTPFASRSYLKNHKCPKVPKDLQEHVCLHFPPIGSEGWKLSQGKSTQTVALEKKIIMNDLNGLKSLAMAGIGIALLPTFLCRAELQSEKLVRVLPEWKTLVQPVHFVYASAKFVPPKLRSFLEIAEPFIRASLDDSAIESK